MSAAAACAGDPISSATGLGTGPGIQAEVGDLAEEATLAGQAFDQAAVVIQVETSGQAEVAFDQVEEAIQVETIVLAGVAFVQVEVVTLVGLLVEVDPFVQAVVAFQVDPFQAEEAFQVDSCAQVELAFQVGPSDRVAKDLER